MKIGKSADRQYKWLSTAACLDIETVEYVTSSFDIDFISDPDAIFKSYCMHPDQDKKKNVVSSAVPSDSNQFITNDRHIQFRE